MEESRFDPVTLGHGKLMDFQFAENKKHFFR